MVERLQGSVIVVVGREEMDLLPEEGGVGGQGSGTVGGRHGGCGGRGGGKGQEAGIEMQEALEVSLGLAVREAHEVVGGVQRCEPIVWAECEDDGGKQLCEYDGCVEWDANRGGFDGL